MFVYESPTYSERNNLWEILESIFMGLQEPWIVIGDFNVYSTSFEKLGGRQVNWDSIKRFGEFISKCDLMNIGFQGPKFTCGKVREILDKGLHNLSWRMK